VKDGGWTITAGGGVSTKAAFNLLGGSVEYDIDFTGTNVGVNANLYTISPTFSGGSSSSFNKNADYCDGQGSGSSWCVEIDWIETNGNCGGATTLHTRSGTGNNGCTAWGCSYTAGYNGKTNFHMKVSYALDGSITVVRDGVTISYSSSYSPVPQTIDTTALSQAYSTKGAVIYSSQWQGWVPMDTCGSWKDLTSSTFTLSNLVINGAVVQGPTPNKCTSSPVSPVAPVPAPVVPVPAPVAPVPAPKVPVAPVPAPTTPPVSSSITCALPGSSNSAWYMEVTTVTGATVTITCSSGTGTTCQVANWNSAYRQCWPQNCQNPTPHCSLTGARLAEEDQTTSTDSATLPGWGIALIVLGAVLVALVAITLAVYLMPGKPAERV